MSVNRSLIGYPSQLPLATMAMITGTAQVAYPVSNLADLKRIRKILQTTASGAIAFKATFSADVSVQFLALIHHNATNGATYRFRSYSDTGLTTLVDDSGTLSFAISANAQFRAITPYALASAQTVRAIRVDLSDIGVAWQIGGFEAAGLWAHDGVSKREIGVKPNDVVTRFPDGGAITMRTFSPRMIGTGRENRSYSADGFTLLDMLRNMGRSEPFVWVRAYEDATTWEREAALVRFSSLPGLSRKVSTLVDFDLSLKEHLR